MIKNLKISFLLATAMGFSVLFSSCKKENRKEEDKTEVITTTTSVSQKYHLDNEKILRLVNELRLKGCDCIDKKNNNTVTKMPAVPAVTWNNLLADAALAHSEDMATKDYFAHEGLDGSTPASRVKKEGYNYMSVGENIAQGYQTEEAVVKGWLDSYGHCTNMMDADFKEMGAARSSKDDYWTQVFGTSK